MTTDDPKEGAGLSRDPQGRPCARRWFRDLTLHLDDPGVHQPSAGRWQSVTLINGKTTQTETITITLRPATTKTESRTR